MTAASRPETRAAAAELMGLERPPADAEGVNLPEIGYVDLGASSLLELLVASPTAEGLEAVLRRAVAAMPGAARKTRQRWAVVAADKLAAFRMRLDVDPGVTAACGEHLAELRGSRVLVVQ